MEPRWQKRAWRIHQHYVKNARSKGNLTAKTDITNFLALAICGECGELANLIKKEWQGDAIDQQAVRDEMADVRIYLEHLARHLGIDLDEACERKVEVVAARLAKKNNASVTKRKK
jgi:NTP pyrophosphatase (non-canonical NTP hydrolase)